MAALFLAGAILSEVCGTLALKLSDGITRPLPALVLLLGYGLGFVLLAQALRTLDVGSLVLIIAGVVGLNLSGGGH
jgi:small multidrug resistance pump